MGGIIMNEYDYNKFLSDSGDDYPTYEDPFIENILSIENILREGDQIMIWKGGYQTSFKNMGTTNRTICRDNQEKSTD